MARKTDGEKIDELSVLAATLTERLDNVRKELRELKDELEEARRRTWLLRPAGCSRTCKCWIDGCCNASGRPPLEIRMSVPRLLKL